MYRLTDNFCGAGGSSEGAIQVPGIEIAAAANHWDLAIETHNSNHPDALHILCDLNVINPRLFPETELAWFSPECPNFSQAKGAADDQLADDLWGESLPTEAAARSRASMWDVVRFTEYHRYLAVVVENVVEVTKWGPNKNGQAFRNWLTSMGNLGYRHEIICVNSMHAQAEGDPAPQSRDRIYIAFTQLGNPAPDFTAVRSPSAVCAPCGMVVAAVQSWKRPGNVIGRYRQQYVYRCPACAEVVEPMWIPALSFIDFSLPSQRIGDRKRKMADKTRRRVAAGIARYWGPLVIEAAGATYDSTDPNHVRHGDPNAYVRAWPATQPVKTIHTTESKALVVPVEGRDGKVASTADQPLRTQTARNETGLAFVTTLKGTSEHHISASSASVEDPARTMAASGNHHALITSYYGTKDGAEPASKPVDTVTTVDRHALVTPAGGSWNDDARPVSQPVRTLTTTESNALIHRNNGGGAEMTTPVGEPVRTVTTAGHQTVLTAEDIEAALARVDDVYFRMFDPEECKRAMAFRPDYTMIGTKRQRVRLSGNAVCPPNSRDILAAVVRSLEGVTL